MKTFDDPKTGNMVLISDDEMSAGVMLFRKKDHELYTEEEIMTLLSDAGVKAGIDAGAVASLTLMEPDEKVVRVAEGKEPVNGFDGHFDFSFRNLLQKTPKIQENGSVDYFDMDLLEYVNEGQELARYSKASGGAMGFTVMGRLILQKKGKEKPAIRGNGFRISKDGTRYYALKSGQVEYEDGVMNITEVHRENGNVNSHTGNIDFDGDVYVHGSVERGSVIRATGNIVVDGIVEASQLEAGKDILLRSGAFGRDEGVISAGGNIIGKFFENISLKADGDIYSSYICESECDAGGSIEVLGDQGTIISGETRALYRVAAKYIGGQSGVNTIIGVGVNTGIMRSFQSYDRRISKLRAEIEVFEQGIRQNLPQKDRMAMAITVKLEDIRGIEKKKKNLMAKMDMASQARIEVKKCVYPGTQLRISNDFLIVSRVMEKVYFMRSQNRVATYKN